MSFENIKSDFLLLDDWEDRYRYVMELGRALPPLPDDLRTDANKVRGCASQVWLATERDQVGSTPSSNDRLTLRGNSDAHIVQGLIAVLFSIYDGKTLQDIATADPQLEFAAIGLKDHLTPQRSNGLAAMVERVKSDARALLDAN